MSRKGPWKGYRRQTPAVSFPPFFARTRETSGYEADPLQYERQRYIIEQVVRTHQTSCLTSEYLLPSHWVPVLSLTHLHPLRSNQLFTLRRRAAENYPIRKDPLSRSARCSFAPKSAFLCVNRSPIPASSSGPSFFAWQRRARNE